MSKIKKTIIFLMVSIIGVIFLLNVSVYNNYVFVGRVNEAIENNNYKEVERLIKSSNANIDSAPFTNLIVFAVTERYVYSPLEMAIQHENIDIIRLLIQNGASVNRQNEEVWGRDSYSPLMRAVLTVKDRFDIIKLLVESGADINFGCCGETPMTLAVNHENNDNIEIIEYFESLGVPIDKQYSYGTILHFACREGNSEVIRYLVKRGLNVNEKNLDYGDTPLINLVYSHSSKEDLIFLIENGADKSIMNNEGLTAYDLAVQRNLVNLAEILKP